MRYINIFLIVILSVTGCIPYQSTTKDDKSVVRQLNTYSQKVSTIVLIIDASASMSTFEKDQTRLQRSQYILDMFNRQISELKLMSSIRVIGQSLWPLDKKNRLIYSLQPYSHVPFGHAIRSVNWTGGKSPLAEAIDTTADDLAASKGEIAIIVVSDGKDMDSSPVLAAQNISQIFGNRLCIYSIIIGQDTTGKRILNQVATTSKCGFSINSDQLDSNSAMASFVQKVFFSDKVTVSDYDSSEIPKTSNYDIHSPQIPDDVTFDDSQPREMPQETAKKQQIYEEQQETAKKQQIYEEPQEPTFARPEPGKSIESKAPQFYEPFEIEKTPPPSNETRETWDEFPGIQKQIQPQSYLLQENIQPKAKPILLSSTNSDPKKPTSKVRLPDRDSDADSDNDTVDDAYDQCPDTPIGARVNNIGCWIVSNIFFDSSKSIFKARYYPELFEIIAVLKRNPELKIEIQGHADNIGGDEFNRRLSEQRALSIKNYLLQNDIPSNRMTTVGYGFTRPIAPNYTLEGQIKNRRVEFRIIE